MPKHIEEDLPENIFEEDVKLVPSPVKKDATYIKQEPKSPADLGFSIKRELNLENFMEWEDEENPQEHTTVANAGTAETDSLDLKIEIDEDCIDVETVSEQIPGKLLCIEPTVIFSINILYL